MAYQPAVAAKVNTITSAEGVNSEMDTTGPLWAGNTWTGAGEKIEYQYVVTTLQTDTAGTLFYDFSIDGTNWSAFPVAGFSVSSGINEYHSASKTYRYFRPRFVGAGAPTYFRLQADSTDTQVTLNSPLNQGVSGDSDASTQKAILFGENATTPGSYVPVQTTPDGALVTSTDSSIINFVYDAYAKVVVDTVTDRFDYYSGGLAGTKVAEVEIIYTDSSKIDAISAERTNI